MKSDRFNKGWEKLKEVDGSAGEKVIKSLKDIAPEFADLLIEFPFGDIYTRENLDLKSREIATIAALTVMGSISTTKSSYSCRTKCRLYKRRDSRSDYANGSLWRFPLCFKWFICCKRGIL